MISKRSEFLFLCPLLLGKYVILTTPTFYNQKKGTVSPSNSIWKLNLVTYAIGCSLAMAIIGGLHVEAIVSGHASGIEILTNTFLMPLYIMGIAIEMTILVNYKLGPYVVNQVLDTNKRFVKYFHLSRKTKDGAERTIIACTILGIAITFTAIPSTAFLLQTNPGFFYNIRMETFVGNLMLSFVGSFALGGIMINVVYWGVAMYLQLHSSAQYLQLMKWTEGTTNSVLSTRIRMYRQVRLVHQLMFDNYGKYLLAIIHACAGVLMVDFLFNIIFFNFSTDPFFIGQMCFCFFICVIAFKVISKNICEFTEACEEFLSSYGKNNMPEITEVNERDLQACRPIKVEVKPLMTYDRLSFVSAMQNLVISNTIDLLLAATEMHVQI